MGTEPSEAHELQLLTHSAVALVPQNFAMVESPVPRLAPGSVLIQNVFLAADPGSVVRGARSWPVRTAVPAGPVIGRVLASRDAPLPVGALVRHEAGWSTHTVLARGQYDLCINKHPGFPVHAYLSVLGAPGLLAWAGVSEIAEVRPGETVFVAPAAGAFGAAAARAARLRGAARVVGDMDPLCEGAASADFDALIDGRAEDLGEQLLAAVPRGVHAAILGLAPDVLPRVLIAMAERGRVAWTADAGPRLGVAAGAVMPAAAIVPVRRHGIRLTGYRTADIRHLQDRGVAQLLPECVARRLAVAPPVHRNLAELARGLADLANGSSFVAEVYQIAEL